MMVSYADTYIMQKLKISMCIKYMNDGDWVESLTALVEHHDGQWEIVTWTQEKDDVVDDIDSGTPKRSTRHTRKNNFEFADQTSCEHSLQSMTYWLKFNNFKIEGRCTKI
jgi:hypothetical protein